MGWHKLWNSQVVVAAMSSPSIVLTNVTSQHTIAAKFTEGDGTFSAISVILQATDDSRDVADADANWFDITTHAFSAGEISSLDAIWHIVDKPLKRIRVNASVVTGVGTTDTVTLKYLPGEI